MRKNSFGRKKKQVLREAISARILAPVLDELKWAEQKVPYLTRSELVQAAIAYYVRDLRKGGIETGSWFPQWPKQQLTNTSDGGGAFYQEIRDLWQRHERAEDQRDIPGILNTLVPDCVYELPQWGYRWDGHDGARDYYNRFYQAFPEVTVHHKRIVIGPQGVAHETKCTATQVGPWLNVKPQKKPRTFSTVLFLIWDEMRERFKGECLYFDFQTMSEGAGSKLGR